MGKSNFQSSKLANVFASKTAYFKNEFPPSQPVDLLPISMTFLKERGTSSFPNAYYYKASDLLMHLEA
jgi:hypothetical protein